MLPLSGETVYLALLRAGVGVGRAGGTLLRSYKETPALAWVCVASFTLYGHVERETEGRALDTAGHLQRGRAAQNRTLENSGW